MRKPGILWCSPLPPTRSGVADYAAEILPELARLTSVAVVEPPEWTRPTEARWLDGLKRVREWRGAPDGRHALLHLGNNPYHVWVARRLRADGGIVVLHDTVLHHLLVEEAAADRAWERFGEEMRGAYGEAGHALAAARRWGYSGRLDPFLFPARSVLLRHARAVIVHSESARRDVVEACPGLPVARVPLAVDELPAGDRSATRRRLGVGRDEVLLVHLGFLTPAKGMDTVLHALVALRELAARVRLLVVGEGTERASFAQLVEKLGLESRVSMVGYASRAELGDIVTAADLGLVPRYPTAGETSAAALRFLAAGTPVVLSGYRQFLEFPCAAAFRVSPGRCGMADLVRRVCSFAASAELQQASREAARRAWEHGGHAPRAAAGALLGAVKELAGGVV